jgi:hypothetical protein
MNRKALAFSLIITVVLAIVIACAPSEQVFVSPLSEPPSQFGVRVVMTPGPPVAQPTLSYGGLYEFGDWNIATQPNEYQIGSHNSWPWYIFEPTVGNRNFAELTGWIDAKVARGMKIGIGISALDFAPTNCTKDPCWEDETDRSDFIWLPSDLLEVADMGDYWVSCPTVATAGHIRHRIPAYWTSAYQTAISNFATALSNYLVANHPGEVDWIVLPLGNYSELNPAMAQDWKCLQLDYDVSYQELTTAWKRIIEIWDDAFEGSGIDLAISTTNFYVDRYVRKEVGKYAAEERGVGVGHHKVMADQDDGNYETDESNNDIGQYDSLINYIYEVPIHGEKTHKAMAYCPPDSDCLNDIEDQYWSLIKMIGLKGDVLRTNFLFSASRTLTRLVVQHPQVREAAEMFNEFAGQTVETTDRAIVWLRESEWDWWPICGNFSWYLYSGVGDYPASHCPTIDDADKPPRDGWTVPVWNVTDCIGGPGAIPEACDPRGRYARRTNETNGVQCFYFDVDNQFFHGTANEITIQVTYMDVGRDAIVFEYQKLGYPELQQVVDTKTNGGEWVDWYVNLEQVIFDDGIANGWDFRICSNGDGDETLHRVIVNRPGNYGPTPTPTSGATPTPTPTSRVYIEHYDPNIADSEISAYGYFREFGEQDRMNLLAQAPNETPGIQLTPQPTRPGNPTPTATPNPLYERAASSIVVSIPEDLLFWNSLDEATINFYARQAEGDVAYISVHELKRDFYESDVSWINPWATPGAYDTTTDWNPTPYATIVFDPQYGAGWISVPLTPDVNKIKLQPDCRPNADGLCNTRIELKSNNNTNLAGRPYLGLILADGATLTPSPTYTALPIFPTPYGTPPPNTSTPGPTGTQTPTWTPVGTATATHTATNTPTPTDGPSPTPTPTATITPTPSWTPTPTTQVAEYVISTGELYGLDSWISSNHPGSGFFDHEQLVWDDDHTYLPLLRFDASELPTVVPTWDITNVLSAEVYVYLENTPTPVAMTVNQLLRDDWSSFANWRWYNLYNMWTVEGGLSATEDYTTTNQSTHMWLTEPGYYSADITSMFESMMFTDTVDTVDLSFRVYLTPTPTPTRTMTPTPGPTHTPTPTVTPTP